MGAQFPARFMSAYYDRPRSCVWSGARPGARTFAAAALEVLRTPSAVRVPNAGAVRDLASAAAGGTWPFRIEPWLTRLFVPDLTAAVSA